MSSVKNYLLNLNLFESSDDSVDREDEHRRRSNIIATRVYPIFLALALIILSLVSWLALRTKSVTVEYPSKVQFEALPFDAHCPCSRMSIAYGEFTSIQSTFHQVCSSDFVSDRWIEAIYSGSNATYFDIQDFRRNGSAQFEALASFCRLSNASVVQSISLFHRTSLISPQVQSETVFKAQVQASIEQFQSTAPNQFGAQLELVREMIKENRLNSGLQTNNILFYSVDGNERYGARSFPISYPIDEESLCSCFTDLDCGTDSIIMNVFEKDDQVDDYDEDAEVDDYDEDVLMFIPGFVAGCLPVNSLLLSTLECFYNQTCLNELLSFFLTTKRFTAMIASKKSHFKSNSTIKTIVDRLMIEEWIPNISYEKYYAQCAPILCTYSKHERYDFLFVLTRLIRLLGGLTVIFGLIIPILIRFIRRPRNVESIPLSIRFRQIKTKLTKILIELNIFKHHGSNEHQVHYQRIATRLYILIFVISLIILTFYSLLIKEIHHGTVLNPTESEYNRLEQIYSDSLSCPCTSISMNYSTFINIEPQYHQVRLSDLVSTRWINYNEHQDPVAGHAGDDYRSIAGSYWQLLAIFYQESRTTVDDALRLFFQTQFVSSQVISQQLFESQVNLSIRNWQSGTIERFLHTIQLVQKMNFGNQLMSNAVDVEIDMNGDSLEFIMEAEQPGKNCSCALSRSCRSPMRIYLDQPEFSYIDDRIVLVYIPNFFAGCSPVENLLQSTLECFYNRSCMIDIDQYMYWHLGPSINFSALDSNRNWPNETIQSIVNRLMIDSWNPKVSFPSYYNKCAPLICTFEYIGRSNIFLVIMTIIGVFGGLSFGFKLPILIALRFFEKMMNNFSRLAFQRTIKNLFICHTEHQIISRLHFILLVITLCVLYSLFATTLQSTTVQIIKPSLSTYQDLATDFSNISNSLQCSCSHISIKYQSFLTIMPRFHQICSSEFVSDGWIEYLYGEGDLVRRFLPTDFRASATGQFQLLASLCQLSQETINDSLSQLMTSDMIHSQLLSSNLLDERLQTIINEFKFTTPNLLISTLNLIREITGANMIMSTLSTNWRFIPDTIINPSWKMYTEPLVYKECTCGLSWKCIQPSRGMIAGCYPIEALLQSTLQCFYDQECIDSNGIFPKLNISSLEISRFNINTTIELILNHLMVEEYSTNISYERYFNQCAPSSCTYSSVGSLSTIEVITSLIGLYSGLIIITKCIAFMITKLWFYRKHRITPEITEQNG